LSDAEENEKQTRIPEQFQNRLPRLRASSLICRMIGETESRAIIGRSVSPPSTRLLEIMSRICFSETRKSRGPKKLTDAQLALVNAAILCESRGCSLEGTAAHFEFRRTHVAPEFRRGES
jgi:hypothetical protein